MTAKLENEALSACVIYEAVLAFSTYEAVCASVTYEAVDASAEYEDVPNRLPVIPPETFNVSDINTLPVN